MKARLLKRGVPLLLVAVTIAALVLSSLPVISQAAAKGTTYNVVIQGGSPVVALVSVNGGAGAANPGTMAGVTFQLVVGAKLAKDKSGSYYPVTIPAKSWKAPTNEYAAPGGVKLINYTSVAGDGTGKLYPSGGAVDVSNVLGAKLASTISGAGPAGSMIIQMTTVSNLIDKSSGKSLMKVPNLTSFTTGKSYLIVKGTKSRLEGKAVPDSINGLPNPLVGTPVDLNAGTGTLVATQGGLNVKNKLLGVNDNIVGQVLVMKISK